MWGLENVFHPISHTGKTFVFALHVHNYMRSSSNCRWKHRQTIKNFAWISTFIRLVLQCVVILEHLTNTINPLHKVLWENLQFHKKNTQVGLGRTQLKLPYKLRKPWKPSKLKWTEVWTWWPSWSLFAKGHLCACSKLNTAAQETKQ